MDPVFLFGVDHSGTTLAYRMLAYHPELVWFSQFTLRDGSIPGRPRRPGAGALEPRLRLVSHAWDKGDPAWRRWLSPRPGEEGQIWDHLLADRAAAPAAVRECLTEFSSRHDGRRVLAKRPALVGHLGALRRAFPDARFVHVVRDGRPVSLSVRAKTMAGLKPGESVDPERALNAAATGWVDALERVEDSAPQLDLLEIRYEDLCTDVHGILAAVLDFAGLDRSSFPFRRCPRALVDRNTKWLDRASEAELDLIEGVAGPTLERYGYERTRPARSARAASLPRRG